MTPAPARATTREAAASEPKPQPRPHPHPRPRPRTRPQVDVGVVTWNTAELTSTALRRLLDTDQGCDLRLLIHDNASTDQTPQALAEAVPEAHVEVSTRNLGFAKAVNRLLQRSDAPWFLALNSDAWPEPGAIAAMVEAAEADPRAAAVAPLLRRPDGTIEHSTHPFPSLAVAALDAVGGRKWLPQRQLDQRCLEGGWHHDRPRRVDWAVGAALLLRRSAVDEIGGLDERFFMYVEDLEWCWRATRDGWHIRFEPSAVVRHVGNASGATRWGDRRIGLEAANLKLFLHDALGPRRAAAYRAFQAGGCAARMVAARAYGDRASSNVWKRMLKAELGLIGPPPADADDDDLEVVENQANATPVTTVTPRIAVVVPTHGRAGRLERLIHALEAQTLPSVDIEVLIVDDASPDDTVEVVERLSRSSRLDIRLLRQPVNKGPAAARNLGWQSAMAPVIAFTDDDCVPGPTWLEAGLVPFADGRPVMVAGRTRAPAEQLALADAPFSRAMEVDHLECYETCNVFYRRRDLKATGGFDERFRRPSGEDLHLALAVIARGVEPEFVADAVVEHDVRPGDFAAAVREAWRWADLPLLVHDHPEARLLMHRVVFWKGTHPPVIAAAGGLALATWSPWALLLTLPWLRHRLLRTPEGTVWNDRVRALPGALALDLTEVVVMARGSVRHRTVLL